MKISKDYFSPSLERMCVYIAVSKVISVCLQRAFREKKRDRGRQTEREREHMSGGVQSLRYYHMKDLLSLCMDRAAAGLY